MGLKGIDWAGIPPKMRDIVRELQAGQIEKIELTSDNDGKITGGTATLSSGTAVPITVKKK